MNKVVYCKITTCLHLFNYSYTHGIMRIQNSLVLKWTELKDANKKWPHSTNSHLYNMIKSDIDYHDSNCCC